MSYLYFSLSLWKLEFDARHEKQTIIFFFLFFFLINFLFFQIENPTKAFIHLKSCAAIQQEWPQAESGYYWITIGSREVQVYCDMTNYGKPQLK